MILEVDREVLVERKQERYAWIENMSENTVTESLGRRQSNPTRMKERLS